MLGTRSVGRALVFGIGYVVGTRAGRERYEQIQRGAQALALRLRDRVDESRDAQSDGARSPGTRSPGSRASDIDPPGDTSTLGR